MSSLEQTPLFQNRNSGRTSQREDELRGEKSTIHLPPASDLRLLYDGGKELVQLRAL
jgi:hypothetical protein